MAFATRCPDCKAKLRLPEAPDADENIECPKCGSLFIAGQTGEVDDAPVKKSRDESPVERPKKKKPKKVKAPAGPAGPKKRKIKKKKTNPVVLFGILGVALAFVIALSIFAFIYISRAGKMEEMLAQIPTECNLVRGINVGAISKYPAFKQDIDPFITNQITAASDELASSLGLEDGDVLRDYIVIAKTKKENQVTGTMYIFRAKKSLKPNILEGASGLSSSGNGAYSMKGKGLLDGANVFNPTNKLIVVVPKGPHQSTLTSGVAGGGIANKDKTFLGKVGDTGRRVTAGNHWCLVTSDGSLKNYAKEIGETVKNAFPGFNKACSTAKCIGWWTSYSGKGISFGGGVDSGDSTGAYDAMKSMRDGVLGQGDDAELPNDFKKAVPGSSSQKDFGEFLQYLKFNYTGSCAFFTTKTSLEKGRNYTRIMHTPSVAGWDNDSPTRGGGGIGGPGGPGGPGGRGP